MPIGAHELGSHAVLLITKYMLDAGAFARGRPRVSGFKKFESSLGSQLLSA
jgi:hypothetical protein